MVDAMFNLISNCGSPQVTQARNASVGTVAEPSKYKRLYGENNDRWKLSDLNKSRLTLLELSFFLSSMWSPGRFMTILLVLV